MKESNTKTAPYRIALFCLEKHVLRANFNVRLEKYQKEAQKQEDFLNGENWLKITHKTTEKGYNLARAFLKEKTKEWPIFTL